MTIGRPDRLRLAELTSGVGAVVLGIGLGVLTADSLGRFGLPLLLVGLVEGAAWPDGPSDRRMV